MADSKVSALTSASALDGTEKMHVVQSGDKAATVAQIKTFAQTGPAAFEFVIDGGGVPITAGVKGDIEIPFACTITGVTMLADQSGSIVVQLWKDSYANYPPTLGDSIVASAPPTITSAIKSQDTTLTGWNKSLSAGDILRFNVASASVITRCTLSLKVTR